MKIKVVKFVSKVMPKKMDSVLKLKPKTVKLIRVKLHVNPVKKIMDFKKSILLYIVFKKM